MADVNIKIGQQGSGKIVASNRALGAVAFAVGSVRAASSDPTVGTVVKNPADESEIFFTPLKVGTTTLTVSLNSLGNKTISKVYTVQVEAAPPDIEAVDFKVTFTIR